MQAKPHGAGVESGAVLKAQRGLRTGASKDTASKYQSRITLVPESRCRGPSADSAAAQDLNLRAYPVELRTNRRAKPHSYPFNTLPICTDLQGDARLITVRPFRPPFCCGRMPVTWQSWVGGRVDRFMPDVPV